MMTRRGIFHGVLMVGWALVTIAPFAEAQRTVASWINTNCVILTTNETYCFGMGGYNGDSTNQDAGNTPDSMGANLTAVDWGTDLIAETIAVGGMDGSTTCAIVYNPSSPSTTREVRCFGDNTYNQTGIGAILPDSDVTIGDEDGEMGNNLTPVSLGTGLIPVSIAVGGGHACAIVNNAALTIVGKVKCWGDATVGQLGNDEFESLGGSASDMGNDLPFMAVSERALSVVAGFYYTCVLVSDTSIEHGDVYCTGSGSNGEIGQGTPMMVGTPAKVDIGAGLTARKLSGGGQHVCVLIEQTRQVKCWGSGAFRANGLPFVVVGDNSEEMGEDLNPLDFGADVNVTDVFTGPYHTCVTLTDGALKCFGLNDNGQLGSDNACSQPYTSGDGIQCPVTTLATSNPVNLGQGMIAEHVSIGLDHTCVLLNKEGARMKCFGRGEYGQLGYGNSFDKGKTSGSMNSLTLVDVNEPSASPTQSPTTSVPSEAPTKSPTTSAPSTTPTFSSPSQHPSKSPTTTAPSTSPSKSPSMSSPSQAPILTPTSSPVPAPSRAPSTSRPSFTPTLTPTVSKAPTVSTGTALVSSVGIAVGSLIGVTVFIVAAGIVYRRSKSPDSSLALAIDPVPEFAEIKTLPGVASYNPAFAARSSGSTNNHDRILQKLKVFYSKVDPNKNMQDVNDLADWGAVNGEEVLFTKLRNKYGVDPSTVAQFDRNSVKQSPVIESDGQDDASLKV